MLIQNLEIGAKSTSLLLLYNDRYIPILGLNLAIMPSLSQALNLRIK